MQSVGIFVKNLTSGGAEKQAVLLARTLSKEVKTHFIVFNADKVHEKYLTRLKEDSNISIALFSGGHISRFNQFVRYIRTNRIDILFSYLAAANLYACLVGKLTHTKVYTGLRNVDLPWKKRLVDRLLTNHFATGTIVNCFTGKQNFVRHGFAESRLTVIPNGFENIQPYKPRMQANVVRVITVGRFHPQKDYDTALRVFAELHRKNKKTAYDIIGYGEEEEFIKNRVKELGLEASCRIFINPDNISELLDSADIYLSTSLIEGTSNSIMEAMNASLPIVATNVGDNSYLIEEGVNGYLLPIKDVEGIATKLTALVDDINLRQQMGKESLARLIRNYSVEAFRNNYMKILIQES